MKTIYFVSGNKNKYEEIKAILNSSEYCIEFSNYGIEELQTQDYNKLITDKLNKAFEKVKRPVLTEHTMLCIKAFEGLPNISTQSFYETMGAEKICDFCRNMREYDASAHSIIGYCDGKKIKIIHKYINGWISEKPSIVQEGKKAFGWDIIFIPDSPENPEKKTMYELGDKKNDISMRKIALEEFRQYLSEQKQVIDSTENEYDKYVKQIARLIKDNKLMLFIGAGISNSVELPTWDDLIKKLGNDLGYEADIFKCYGNYMLLAEYYKLINGDDLLLQKLQEHLKVSDEKIQSSVIYPLIAELKVPIIYTTNYDNTLERYYEIKKIPLQVINSVGDIRNISDNIPRMMKFHGNLDKKESIVLSESQYFERMDFSSFFDLQFQADLARYNVL